MTPNEQAHDGVAWSRVVLILAALAAAALLIMIVVGALTSDMTDEIDSRTSRSSASPIASSGLPVSYPTN